MYTYHKARIISGECVASVVQLGAAGLLGTLTESIYNVHNTERCLYISPIPRWICLSRKQTE